MKNNMKKTVYIIAITLVTTQSIIFAKESTGSNINMALELFGAFAITLLLTIAFVYSRTKNKMIKEHNAKVLEKQQAAKRAKKQAKRARHNK